MYEFLGITLVLALLLTINATATLVAAGVGRLCKPLLWNVPHARALKYSS